MDTRTRGRRRHGKTSHVLIMDTDLVTPHLEAGPGDHGRRRTKDWPGAVGPSRLSIPNISAEYVGTPPPG